jgi:PAS domain-containing protein
MARKLQLSVPLSVLIVEHSEDDTRLLLRELQRGGFEPTHERVETAGALRAALAQQAWDVVISDYTMPSFTGLRALEIVQGSGLDLPFITVSGTVGEEVAVGAMKTGTHDYILKGNLPRLVPAIKRELREAESRRKRKLAEEEIRVAKEDWELTVDTVPDLILVMDEECRITRANRAVAAVTGLEPAQIIGRHCYEVLHGGTEPRPDCPHQKLIRTGAAACGDIYEPWLDKFFASSTTPLRARGGVCVDASTFCELSQLANVSRRRCASQRSNIVSCSKTTHTLCGSLT